jgi:hypothetical protein
VTTEQMMRLKQRKRDKRRYLKVRPKDGGPWAVIQPHELSSMLDEDDKDSYEIVETWMTIDEYEALAEFEGW